MKTEWTWLNESLPNSIGWYAILYSYSFEDEFYAAIKFWDGQSWKDQQKLNICAYIGPFESEIESKNWLKDNDNSYYL